MDWWSLAADWASTTRGKIARLHGGDVALVESKVNEGSTFRILLPYGERSDME